eukprot:11189699-Lingulodinium_polyedra.AAC.1
MQPTTSLWVSAAHNAKYCCIGALSAAWPCQAIMALTNAPATGWFGSFTTNVDAEHALSPYTRRNIS